MLFAACNICNADDTVPVTSQNGYRVVRCRNCGLVYVNPRPLRSELIALYETYHQRGKKDEHSWQRLMRRNFAEVSDLLSSRCPQKGSLLDIGCGYGHFLELMKGRGWSVAGLEPSEGPSAYASEKGLNVSRSIIEEAFFPEKSFEAITAFYVLEHLSDPLGALKKIRKWLKPGGLVVLRVPHTTPLVKLLAFFRIKNHLYDLPFHLYDFSPATIRRLMEAAGMEEIKVMPGRPTSPPRPAERFASVASGTMAGLLFSVSGGRLLLPGISKTVLAVRPQGTDCA